MRQDAISCVLSAVSCAVSCLLCLVCCVLSAVSCLLCLVSCVKMSSGMSVCHQVCVSRCDEVCVCVLCARVMRMCIVCTCHVHVYCVHVSCAHVYVLCAPIMRRPDRANLCLTTTLIFLTPTNVPAHAHTCTHVQMAYAKAGSQVIGYIVFVRDGDLGKIIKLCVSPALRRKGIGTPLVHFDS